MGVELTWQEFKIILKEIFNTIGIPLKEPIVSILTAAMIAAAVGIFRSLYNALLSIYNLFRLLKIYISGLRYNADTNAFIRLRSLFAEHQKSEIISLNSQSDWDDFLYTNLEAEVEVDSSFYIEPRGTSQVIWFVRTLYYTILSSLRRKGTAKEKNLIDAIRKSKARVFLIIGDPGSGKTVSLRHLFLNMAKSCIHSRSKTAIVPLYLNLKRLKIPAHEITAEHIYDWVKKELQLGQTRVIHDFMNRNFEEMLGRGEFFFLFDSFDEIPAVMDAQEDELAVRQYAEAISRFLYSPHGCRGLLSSRPYREPKVFNAQRVTILPLPNKRVRQAMKKHLAQESRLEKRIWNELLSTRDDLLYVARNPFYLSLIAGYVKREKDLPQQQYGLFEYFVQTRAKADTQRLQAFNITPEELLASAGMLAYTMTREPSIGLEANTELIREKLKSQYRTSDRMTDENIDALFEALSYSKMARMQKGEINTGRSFCFVHRRFQEYFCSRFLVSQPSTAPLEELATDNRWREVLVLLCETLPSTLLQPIFEIASQNLVTALHEKSSKFVDRRAVETLHFLRDGFRSRLTELPLLLREQCSAFIQKQLLSGSTLDKKRAIESVILADELKISVLIEKAIENESEWVRDTSLKACRLLSTLSAAVASSIRKHLLNKYRGMQLYKDHKTWSTLFSTGSLRSVAIYYKVLIVTTIAQCIFYSVAFLYGVLTFNPVLLLILPSIFITWIFAERYGKRAIDDSTNYLEDIIYILFNFFGFPGVAAGVCMMIFALYKDYKEYMNVNYVRFQFEFFYETVAVFFWVNMLLFNWAEAELEHKRIKIPKKINIDKPIMLSVLFICIFFFLLNGLLNLLVKFLSSILDNFKHEVVYVTALILILISLFISYKLIIEAAKITLDQFILSIFKVWPVLRPQTTSEAVSKLSRFQTERGKVQYIHALRRWLRVSSDWEILENAAKEYSGDVNDALYELVEVWQDATTTHSGLHDKKESSL